MKLVLGLLCMLGLYQSASASTLRSAYKTNLCMDVNRDPGSWRFQTNIEVWPCHGQQNQQFGLQPQNIVGNETIYTIQAMGKCVDIDMGFLQDWTHQNNVQLYDCNGGVNQQFRVEAKGGGWFMLRSMFDNRCLDIDLNTANGWRYEHNVQLWSCSGDPNQLWKFESSGGGHDNDDIIVIPVD